MIEIGIFLDDELIYMVFIDFQRIKVLLISDNLARIEIPDIPKV